ncbi:phosphotransferase [Nonomuraea soli]|uniref:Aminoglycoside phosphotransferase domain-containing protein n=1 Tax=Nonomuraea soli TaxID=1032476 RepID=A0A7W0CMF1_9ACTN|nr:phosphotransferase [Nonomuraea soli]MBA2893886.1 hypothetical protein [Nonomuraea soli]
MSNGVGILLDGGNDRGAMRVGTAVVRRPGPWTPAVHALLRHLERKRFPGAPRVLGFDGEGREQLTFLDGETMGSRQVWPEWTRTDDILRQVAWWLRDYHLAVRDFVPPGDAFWRCGDQWSPGLIIGHNDASPYNAAWDEGRLTGFFDWDFAGPATVFSDLAWTAMCWVPMHARHVAAGEGFDDFAGRPRRLRLFLREYGYRGRPEAIVQEVRARMLARAEIIRQRAATGEDLFVRLLDCGVAGDMALAARELEDFF